jgi:hypothetical protein
VTRIPSSEWCAAAIYGSTRVARTATEFRILAVARDENSLGCCGFSGILLSFPLVGTCIDDSGAIFIVKHVKVALYGLCRKCECASIRDFDFQLSFYHGHFWSFGTVTRMYSRQMTMALDRGRRKLHPRLSFAWLLASLLSSERQKEIPFTIISALKTFYIN